MLNHDVLFPVSPDTKFLRSCPRNLKVLAYPSPPPPPVTYSQMARPDPVAPWWVFLSWTCELEEAKGEEAGRDSYEIVALKLGPF